MLRLAISFSLFFNAFTYAAMLPTGMNRLQVEKTVQVIGTAGAARLLRSAESYEFWPGFKFGANFSVASSKSLDTYGNQDGSVPGLLVLPRLFIAKGLFWNIELMASVFPGGSVNAISATGIGLKWTFKPERRHKKGSVAVYGMYTSVSGMRLYSGSDFEFGVIASRDLVRIKPYLGLGILYVSGTVDQAATAQNSATHMTLHLFGGLEWEGPITLAAQIDFMNVNLQGSFSIGKRF